MINIYDVNNTSYSNNGDATLIPIRCDLVMTINGGWSLELEHPYDREGRWKHIREGAVIQADIRCIRELSSVRQRFRVYDYIKGVNSVTCIAFPVAMESTHDAPVDNLVISGKTGVQAMAALQAFTNKYTLSTDITDVASTSFSNTNVNSAIASGDENCFIEVWGGEICYDNLTFKVRSRLGSSQSSGHKIIYGKDITDIAYEKNDSGLITRIYPVSQDGIRLNGTGYVDSSRASQYPVIHSRFIQAPYKLVEDNASSSSATAQLTASIKSQVQSLASSLSHTVYNSAVANKVEIEYIKKIRSDIVEAVQAMATAEIYHSDLNKVMNAAIKSGMEWLKDVSKAEWTWHGSESTGWWYGSSTSDRATSEYEYIDRKWSYFGSNSLWQRPKDDSSGNWDWIQKSSGKWYGNNQKYFAQNTYVYITMNGQMKEYWFDKEGWYDSDKSGDSDYAWHGSGTSADPYWFGDDSTTGKYLKEGWWFIDGNYCYFDEYGYCAWDDNTRRRDYQWDWVEDGDNWWFGNAVNKEYAMVWATNQWLKVGGDWYRFDSSGYAIGDKALSDETIALFTSGMAQLKTLCNTLKTQAYNLLYSQMTSYCAYCYKTGIDVPSVTITVNMVDLSNTEAYEDYSYLEKVYLGDSVTALDYEHSISAVERVVGITYDCIREVNSEVVIGVAGSTVAEIVGNAGGSSVAGGFDTSVIESTLTSHGNSIASLQSNKQDKLTAGSGIEIANNVISATSSGQGLLYWEETSEDFTREINEELPDNFTCDAEYLKTDVSYEIQNSSGEVVRPFLKYTGRAICAKFTYWGYISGTSVYRQFWGTAYISTNPDYVKYSTNGGNSWYTYSGTTNINGVTFYISSGQNSVAIQEGYSRVDNTELVDIGDFEDYGSAVEYLINHANIRAGTDVVNETGIGVGNKIIWGGTRYSATEDYPFEVEDDGTVVINKTIFGMGADAHIYYSALWTNYVAGLYNGYEYRKINNEKAIIGAFGYALNIRFILVSTYSNAVKWNWRDRGSIGAWSDMSSYQGEANLGVSFTYKNATWYATCIKGLAGESSPTSYAGIDYIDGSIGNVSNDNVIALAKHFIDVTNATKYVDRTVKLGTGDRIFEYTDDDRLLAYINDDGSSSFDYQLDINPTGTPTNKLSKVGYEGDIYSAKEVGTGTSNPSGGFRDDVYYKYEYTTQMVDDEITLPTFTDDVSTKVTISDFSKYVNAKFVYTDQGGGINEKTVTIASLPETTNPSSGQGGDIYIFNAYLYIVCGRDSSGLWIKECGDSLQELYCEYESNEYTVLAHYVNLGGTWVQVSTGGGTQIQSDWNQTDTSAVDYIKNKPTIPEIEANPSGTATGSLTKVEIDGVIYSISGGSGGSFYEKTTSEYNALPSADKQDPDKLYFINDSGIVETAVDMSNITKYVEYNAGITATSSTQTDLTWDGGSVMGQTYYYTVPIDVTDIDKITYDLVTGSSFNTDSGWATNPARNLGIGVKSSPPSSMTLINSIGYAVYNEYGDSDVRSTFDGEEIDVSNLTGTYYFIVAAAGWNATIKNVKTVKEGQALDPNYTYYKAENDTIVVRVYHEGESDEEIKWFFCGYTKSSSDADVPSNLLNYVPTLTTSITSQAMSPTNEESSYDYWIGWSRSIGNTKIRTWNSSWGSTVGGTFWGVVDLANGDEQTNVYEDPYIYIQGETPNCIYYKDTKYAESQTLPLVVENGKLCIVWDDGN